MKTLPGTMQADLDGRATHHCFCWEVTRGDGLTFGFTDHDRNLTFNSTTFVAETGLTASALENNTGLSVDNMDVMGVLNSISIDEQDLAAGLYDNATITAYRVDWQDTTNRVVMLKGSIGEVSRGSIGFTAEIRGLAHELNQATGRVYAPTCSTQLGSAKCKVSLGGTSDDGYDYTISTTVTAVGARNHFRADTAAAQALPSGWFTRGKLTWTSGNNDGLEIEVRVHTLDESLGNQYVTFSLWEPMPFEIQIGDGFDVHAGCDLSAAVCLSKFNNLINFRGFNLVPGNDIVLKTAATGDDHSGGSIFS